MTTLSPQPRRPLARLCRGAGAFLLGWAGLPAADWSSLINNAPFGQPVASTSAATGDLEFRGVVQEENSYLINLYNPATKTSQWVPVNGTAPGLEVKSYDASAEKVQISQAGRALTLPLKQAKVTLLATASVPPGAGKPDGDGGPDGDRRAEIRDMIRQRMQNGGPEVQAFTRNLPPEAQAMIEEFRRRRAENGGPQQGPQPQFQPGQQVPQALQPQQGQRRQRGNGQH
ncbi:MAG: hypothetical protein JWQ62_1687 [Lacunisphaera sp.]|nr:hypothetical protein [Lacunisphaera sp.]